MTNLEWIRTLSAKELSDLLYDYWLPRGQYVWTDSRKGLVKMLCETYLERDCDKCKHQGNCYCVKGLGCPFDPKTKPSNSEKPNNCEHITEDGVTCAKYPACDDCLDNPLNKVKGSERLVKGKTEPTISKMEQVEDEPKTQMKPQNSNLTFEKADEPQTDNLFTDKDGDVWEWRGDAWYCISGDKPQTEQVGVPFGEMDEATFKSHCLNCQRDTADIKCLDCDGNKYFLPYGSKTDCAWK